MRRSISSPDRVEPAAARADRRRHRRDRGQRLVEWSASGMHASHVDDGVDS